MSTKHFRIAFSFAGEKRDFVGKVAAILAERFGETAILYDKFHEAEFARDDLAGYLADLYRENSDLIVAVLCPDYDQKEWCGLEWKTIRGLLKQGKTNEIMLTRFQRVEPEALEGLAGYIDLDDDTPESAATLILERLAVNEGHPKDHYIKPQTTIQNNLPQLQPFFGREAELAAIAEALDPASRTWGTLINGAGGKGKTALAVRAACNCPPDNFDRIVFVSVKQQEQDDYKLRRLAGFALSSWMQMLDEIARELELPEVAKEQENKRARLLRDKLAGRRVLLVLDNLETLSDSEQDQLFTFLEFLPSDCKALLTSRTFAATSREAIELPNLEQTSALEMLTEIAKHHPPFANSSDEDRIHLYEQTRGNALLLRWVAGQVGSGYCTNISEALDYLAACPPGNDPLAYIFDDVLNSLGDQEIKLLGALTWPNRSIPVEAIAEIGDIPFAAARRWLKFLTNRSLVVPDQEEKQYALVPMVAEFVRKRRPEVVRQTGDQLEQRAYRLMLENGYEEHDRFPVLEASWPTLAPALPLFLAGPNDRLQTVCDALEYFFEFTGRWDDRLSLCKAASAKAQAAGDEANAGERVHEAGWIHYLRREADDVLRCAEKELEHRNAYPAGAAERASAIRLRGLGHRLQKNYAGAILDFGTALDLYATLPAETKDVAIVLNYRGEVERVLKDFDGAERDFQRSLEVATAVGFDEGVACYTGDLAKLALDQLDWVKAEGQARAALPLAKTVGRQELIGDASYRLATALLHQGKAAEALPHASLAVEIYTKLRSRDLAEAEATLAKCKN